MFSILPKISDSLLNLAFPTKCHSCGGSVTDSRMGVACGDCWQSVKFSTCAASGCQKCGAQNSSNFSLGTCRNCDLHHYDVARSLGEYEGALRATVLNLKRIPVLPKILVERIVLAVNETEAGNCDIIIPVPLSPKRLTERGFNQAEVVAKAFSDAVNRPVDRYSLIRKKHTPMHRAAMDRKAREATANNAFGVERPKLVDGMSILLVDDIFTSGATASNCAKALKKSGAAKVTVVTLAQASLRTYHGRS